MCVWFSVLICLEYFAFSEELSEIWTKMYIGLHVHYSMFLSDASEIWIFWILFSKITQIWNFMKIRPFEAELFNADRSTDRRTKVKLKAVCGSYSTAALRHIVFFLERVPSFISRGAAHTKRRERPLLAKEGTIPGIYLAIRNSRKLLGSLTFRKAGTWDRFFYFPSGGRHTEDF